MTLGERIVTLADEWARANDRSVATLGSRLVNDSRIVERLRGGASCTTVTAERFFGFFREGLNWPTGVAPSIVVATLDAVDLGAVLLADAEA